MRRFHSHLSQPIIKLSLAPGIDITRLIFIIMRMGRFSFMDNGQRGSMMELTTSVEYVRLIVRYAEASGLEPERIYEEAGFDAAILEIPGARISFHEFIAFWDALEAANQDPDLGLHLEEKLFLFPGHILFFLILNAPTIRGAVDEFCRFFNVLTDIHSPRLTFSGDLAALSVRFHTPDISSTRHTNEGIMAAYASVLQRISENSLAFKAVHFTHPKPVGITEHLRIFKAPVYFNQAENKLIFSNTCLSLPVTLSDRATYQSLKKMARDMQQKRPSFGPWSDRTRQTVIGMLSQESADIRAAARELGVSPRNLQNRLKNEGVTYQQILDSVRREQALYLLERNDLSISEIALLLAYSEQSAFNRAFKRWMGCTPSQHRSLSKLREGRRTP